MRIDASPAALRDPRNRARPTRGHWGQDHVRARSLYELFSGRGIRRVASLREGRALNRQDPFRARIGERIGGFLDLGADQSDHERTQLLRRSYGFKRGLGEFGVQ